MPNTFNSSHTVFYCATRFASSIDTYNVSYFISASTVRVVLIWKWFGLQYL